MEANFRQIASLEKGRSSMNIEGCVALVTGANRGIGEALAHELLARGAAKVYACARTPALLQNLVATDPQRVIPPACNAAKRTSTPIREPSPRAPALRAIPKKPSGITTSACGPCRR